MAGKQAITVLGPIDSDKLGVTSAHEHIFIDLNTWRQEHGDSESGGQALEPIRLDNLWRVRKNVLASKDNLIMEDYGVAVSEVSEFKKYGGGSMVDCTTRGIRIKLELIKDLSRATGVNIVMGTGYYVGASHPRDMDDRTIDELQDEMRTDIIKGFRGTDIRAGAIGEIGIEGSGTAYMQKNEEKVLRAAARVQAATGVSIWIHPPQRIGEPSGRAFPELFGIIREEGGDLSRVVAGHMDVMNSDSIEVDAEIARRGAYVAYDNWGKEYYHPRFRRANPHDITRIQKVRKMIDAGFLDRLLVGQDVCMKIHLMKYGGFGYGHIPRDVIPMMKVEGITDEQIKMMLVDNPKRVIEVQ